MSERRSITARCVELKSISKYKCINKFLMCIYEYEQLHMCDEFGYHWKELGRKISGFSKRLTHPDNIFPTCRVAWSLHSAGFHIFRFKMFEILIFPSFIPGEQSCETIHLAIALVEHTFPFSPLLTAFCNNTVLISCYY